MIDIKDIKEEDLNTCYKDLAKVLGLETALKLGKEFGGEQLYVFKMQDRKELDKLVDHNPKYADLVKVLGLDATWQLVKEFGGEGFYLPKLDGTRGPLSRARERMILAELKTFQSSTPNLARKYGVTSRCVYDIIKRAHLKMVTRGN